MLTLFVYIKDMAIYLSNLLNCQYVINSCILLCLVHFCSVIYPYCLWSVSLATLYKYNYDQYNILHVYYNVTSYADQNTVFILYVICYRKSDRMRYVLIQIKYWFLWCTSIRYVHNGITYIDMGWSRASSTLARVSLDRHFMSINDKNEHQTLQVLVQHKNSL